MLGNIVDLDLADFNILKNLARKIWDFLLMVLVLGSKVFACLKTKI